MKATMLATGKLWRVQLSDAIVSLSHVRVATPQGVVHQEREVKRVPKEGK